MPHAFMPLLSQCLTPAPAQRCQSSPCMLHGACQHPVCHSWQSPRRKAPKPLPGCHLKCSEGPCAACRQDIAAGRPIKGQHAILGVTSAIRVSEIASSIASQLHCGLCLSWPLVPSNQHAFRCTVSRSCLDSTLLLTALVSAGWAVACSVRQPRHRLCLASQLLLLVTDFAEPLPDRLLHFHMSACQVPCLQRGPSQVSWL